MVYMPPALGKWVIVQCHYTKLYGYLYYWKTSNKAKRYFTPSECGDELGTIRYNLTPHSSLSMTLAVDSHKVNIP